MLKHNGIALVGGGLGRNLPEEIRKQLVQKRKEKMRDPDFSRVRSKDYCQKIVEKTGLQNYRLRFTSFVERWIEIRKKN